MSRYEISIWEDYLVENNGQQYYDERRIAIIGSDTMTSFARAREPQFKENVNGTHKLTFRMLYNYIDTMTGEKLENPFLQYLVNERKIKVLWKEKWYDLIIKEHKDSISGHSVTYSCDDLFINELSRNGFNLTFNTELENNIGTAEELASQVLKGTDWRLGQSETLYQEIEEPVYQVTTLRSFSANKNPNEEVTSIPASREILVYYSVASDPTTLNEYCQFLYSDSNVWQTEEGQMLVINGNCYGVNVDWEYNESTNTAAASLNGNIIFEVDFNQGLSVEYRAKRLVRSQKTVYNDILKRYVNVYNFDGGQDNLLGYYATEFNDALAALNIISNPNNFSNTSGWIGEDLLFSLYPQFGPETVVRDYAATSFLHLTTGFKFNTGIQSNRSFLADGLTPGQQFVFRFKLKGEGADPSQQPYISNFTTVIPSIQNRTGDYQPAGSECFQIVDQQINEDWIEFILECTQAKSYTELIAAAHPFGIFLEVKTPCWLEEAQFYQLIYGNKAYQTDEVVRIDPGEMDVQSVAQQKWNYFLAEQPEGITKDTLKYIWTSKEPWEEAEPSYNNFEKIRTIEAQQSNRFNILQSIAEAFECWIQFDVHHDDTGCVIRDENNLPEKYIYFVKEIGQETSVVFQYGIDLKDTSRRVQSEKIATKTIVQQNENQYGKNGFCSIARSTENYPRENFIYNFDYYINQGLLDRNEINNDLYDANYMGYYVHLHALNVEYADNLEEIINKKTELTKQQATLTVYSQYISSALDEISEIEQDIMKLANAESMEDATQYVLEHLDNMKIQSLIDDRSSVKKTIAQYQVQEEKLQDSVDQLTAYIETQQARQDEIIEELEERNQEFYNKYSRFIQEGTWNDEDYYDDDLYYLDAQSVAYTSSRPQVSYDIDVIRLSELEDFKAKVFQLGDICHIQDTDFFGWQKDGITPYKEKVIISEITSFFDTPRDDKITVQNYKTQFDDLFQRVAAATQSLEFNEGKYSKSYGIINEDGTIKSNILQQTFDSNNDLVFGAQNENVSYDNTGITIKNNGDATKQVKVTSGGIFTSTDGGLTWRNAIRGDGITADAVTTGRLNTEQVVIYGADAPSFSWDKNGINAFFINADGSTNTSKFVRFDKYGLYGISKQDSATYIPTSEGQIYSDADFGMTWSRFFMKSNDELGHSIEISTDKDIVVKDASYDRIVIGRINPIEAPNNYGINIRNEDGDLIFQCDTYGSEIAGWQLGAYKVGGIEQYKYLKSDHIEMRSNGDIGCYASDSAEVLEYVYDIRTEADISAVKSKDTGITTTIPSGAEIFIFSSYIGDRSTKQVVDGDYDSYYDTHPSIVPNPAQNIQVVYKPSEEEINYNISGLTWEYTISSVSHNTVKYRKEQDESYIETYVTTYTYNFELKAKKNDTIIFTIPYSAPLAISKKKFIEGTDLKWKIDNNGDAIFHNILADGGIIAGWHIDSEKIYRTDSNGNIIAQLNSTGLSSSVDNPTIATDTFASKLAEIAGMFMQNGLIDGISITQLAATLSMVSAQAAQALATAQSAIAQLATKSNIGHTHGLTFTAAVTDGGGVPTHYHSYQHVLYVNGSTS